jgi:hypothetical protein
MWTAGSSSGDRVERAVLALLLVNDDADGQRMTELLDEIGERDVAMHALERLCSVGLAEVSGDRVSPSAAARRFDELNL